MPTDITTQHTERFVQTADLRPEAVEALLDHFEQATERAKTGFHGPNDIETLVGLEGTFLWGEDPFTFRSITFAFDADAVGFQGRYKIASGLFPIEEGVFHCVPNNAAIGFAALLLVPQGTAPSRPFFFAGVFIDTNARITVALLNRVGDDGPVNPPFSAVRMG
jgi:hypothetical protein